LADNQKKNDVAAALAALAGGAVPSEGETPSGGIPSETTVFSPPPAQLPGVELPPATSSVRGPVSPVAPRSKSTARAPLPQGKPSNERARSTGERSADRPESGGARPAQNLLPKDLPLPSAMPPPARIRPAGPDGPPRARPAMPERAAPAAAALPAAPVELPEPEPELEPEAFIDDDEDTIAAAPDASAFAPRAHVAKPAHTAIYANLFFRRTIIPILLTCGVMLPALGVWSMVDHNAPLAAIGAAVEVFLIVIGAVLLGLGIVNALHVKHILKIDAKRRTAE
jgi:hypothetical protein